MKYMCSKRDLFIYFEVPTNNYSRDAISSALFLTTNVCKGSRNPLYNLSLTHIVLIPITQDLILVLLIVD